MTNELTDAIDQLRRSERGTRALAALHDFISDHYLGLDELNQSAILDLLMLAQTHAGSVREAMGEG